MLNVFKLATGATLAWKPNDKVFGSLSPGRNQTKILNMSNASPKPLPLVGSITGVKNYWNQILGLNPVLTSLWQCDFGQVLYQLENSKSSFMEWRYK